MVAWLGLIGTIGGMGAQAAGSKAGMEATVEGARTQAEIERMNRAYQQRRFGQELAYQRPFYEAGLAALPKYGQAMRGELDVTQMPLYQYQAGLMQEGLKDAPEYVKERSMQRLGAQEGELSKGRLLDIMQIGLGQAGVAGSSMSNLGSMMAQSYGRSGAAMAGGLQSYATQRESMYGRAAEQIGGLPAYFAAGRQSAPTQPTQSQMPYGAMYT